MQATYKARRFLVSTLKGEVAVISVTRNGEKVNRHIQDTSDGGFKISGVRPTFSTFRALVEYLESTYTLNAPTETNVLN